MSKPSRAKRPREVLLNTPLAKYLPKVSTTFFKSFSENPKSFRYPRVLHQWSRAVPMSIPSYHPVKINLKDSIHPITKGLLASAGAADPYDPYSSLPYGYFGTLTEGSISAESYQMVYGPSLYTHLTLPAILRV